jgi:hypothetical protein
MGKKPEIPTHTKWGIRVTTVIIILISIMIIKNCVGSVFYGVSTEKELQVQYYELGYSHGKQKAGGRDIPPAPEIDNLLLKKEYRKGYRNGWDSVQAERKAAAGSLKTPAATQ